MKLIHLLAFSLALLLAACAAPAPTQTSEVSPFVGASEVSPSLTPRPTKTPLPPATATPKATKTPEPTRTQEVHMTLEDWKKVFSDLQIERYGNTYDLENIIEDPKNLILSNAEEILKIKPHNPIIILHPSGLITVMSEPSYAAEKAKKGAIILTRKDSGSTAFYANDAIIAASNAHRNGNNNIFVTFGEITSAEVKFRTYMIVDIAKDIFTITQPDGRIITPIMDMPRHFGLGYNDGFISLEDAGLGELDPIYWLDQIIKAGFNEINITAQDNFPYFIKP